MTNRFGLFPLCITAILLIAVVPVNVCAEEVRYPNEAFAKLDTFESIAVTYIRGTAEDYLDKHIDVQRRYVQWKAISAQAGKNLLKLTQNKEPEPLPEFDDLDLDF